MHLLIFYSYCDWILSSMPTINPEPSEIIEYPTTSRIGNLSTDRNRPIQSRSSPSTNYRISSNGRSDRATIIPNKDKEGIINGGGVQGVEWSYQQG